MEPREITSDRAEDGTLSLARVIHAIDIELRPQIADSRVLVAAAAAGLGST
jgi:hypothetical protein